MNYAKIKHFDIANGEGVRTSLFVSGCKFFCEDCFNKEAQDFSFGNLFTEDVEKEILDTLKPNIDGISILGGDPLWQNVDGLMTLKHLVDSVHKLNKSVWIWSGFTWEEVFNNKCDTKSEARRMLISSCDVFVDGRFDKTKKNLKLKWCGSENQRVIDVKNSLYLNRVILYGD